MAKLTGRTAALPRCSLIFAFAAACGSGSDPEPTQSTASASVAATRAAARAPVRSLLRQGRLGSRSPGPRSVTQQVGRYRSSGTYRSRLTTGAGGWHRPDVPCRIRAPVRACPVDAAADRPDCWPTAANQRRIGQRTSRTRCAVARSPQPPRRRSAATCPQAGCRLKCRGRRSAGLRQVPSGHGRPQRWPAPDCS